MTRFLSWLLAFTVIATLMCHAWSSDASRVLKEENLKEAAPPIIKDGFYKANGKDSKNSYSAVVSLRHGRDVILLRWFLATNQVEGVGFQFGDRVVVSWQGPISDNMGMHGVTHYTIQGDRLVGRWTSMPGDGRLHDETLSYLLPFGEDD